MFRVIPWFGHGGGGNPGLLSTCLLVQHELMEHVACLFVVALTD